MQFDTLSVSTIVLILFVGISVLGFVWKDLWSAWMLHPHGIMERNRWHQLVTYGFVHGSVGHLLFNAVSYYSIAPAVEAAIGQGGFLFVYFGSLILGALPSVITHRGDPGYRALGASGAVAGLFFSGMLFYPEQRIYLFFLPVGIPYPLFGVLFLAGSWYGARHQRDNIGHDVHMYGALAGLLLTAVLRPDAVTTFIDAVF